MSTLQVQLCGCACWLRSNACYRYRNPAYAHGAYFNDSNTTVTIANAYLFRRPATQTWAQGSAIRDIGAAGLVAGLIRTGQQESTDAIAPLRNQNARSFGHFALNSIEKKSIW